MQTMKDELAEATQLTVARLTGAERGAAAGSAHTRGVGRGHA